MPCLTQAISTLARGACSFSLASGSSGNAIFFRSRGCGVLVDAGISAKRIIDSLCREKCDPSELNAILITHEHADHVAGLEVLARRLRIPIFLTAGTYAALSGRLRSDFDYQIQLIFPGQKFTFGDLEILPIPISHDAAEPVAYRIDDGSERVGIVTDLGYIPEGLAEDFADCDLVYAEANYDEQMLMNGAYPWPLKRRISGAKGHLSNDASAGLLYELLQRNCHRFVLAHLSAENNMPALAELTVRQLLNARGAIAGADYELFTAPRHLPGPQLSFS